MSIGGVIGLTDWTPPMNDSRIDMSRKDAEGVIGGAMEPGRAWQGRRLVEVGVFLALIVGAIFTLPGLGDLRERLTGADPALIALAAALEIGSCLAFVAAFRGVFSRRLSWRFSYEVGMSSQAANVLLPTGGAGGLALGAWALRRVGMPADRIGRRTVAFFLITSSVNFVAVIVAGFGLGLGLMGGEVALAAALVPAFAATAALTAIAFSPRVLEGAERESAGRVRRALAKGRGYAADGIRDAISLLGSGRPTILLGAVGYMALDVLALAAIFAAFGGGAPSIGVFVLAYAVGQLGGLIPVPGGVGGTDGGLILAFGLLGTPVGVAAAAVIGYRAFQLGVPAILGLTAYGSLRRHLGNAGQAERNDVPAPALGGCLEPELA
jgi:uncharacterized membrane protein YbhN (UPF0104 family)